MKLLTANEALQALKDDKIVECKFLPRNDWVKINSSSGIYILLNEANQFRLAQEMITIGDVSFPKPEVHPPKINSKYYFLNFNSDDLIGYYTWKGDSVDLAYLRKGIVHLSEENAIAHAKALIKLSGGSCE